MKKYYQTNDGVLKLEIIDIEEPNNGRMLFVVKIFKNGIDITEQFDDKARGWYKIPMYIDFEFSHPSLPIVFIPFESDYVLYDYEKNTFSGIKFHQSTYGFMLSCFYKDFFVAVSAREIIIKNLLNDNYYRIKGKENEVYKNVELLNNHQIKLTIRAVEKKGNTVKEFSERTEILDFATENKEIPFDFIYTEGKCLIIKNKVQDWRAWQDKFYFYKTNLLFSNFEDLYDFLKFEYDRKLDFQKTKEILSNPLYFDFEWDFKEDKTLHFKPLSFNFLHLEGEIIDWEEGKYLFYKENEQYIFKIYEKEEQSREIILTSKQIKEFKIKKTEFASQFYLQQSEPKPEKSLNIFQWFIQKIKNN